MDVRIQAIHFDATEKLVAFINKNCLLYTSDAADEL